MLVLIHWHGRNVAVPLSQLSAIDADESAIAATGEWHYWLAQGIPSESINCGES